MGDLKLWFLADLCRIYVPAVAEKLQRLGVNPLLLFFKW